MPPTAGNEVPAPFRSWLDRHDERRREGIPTVSVVLEGENALLSLLAWGRAAGKGRALVAPPGDDFTEEGIVRGWLVRLLAAVDLEDAATHWLAGRLGRDPDELRQSLKDRSRFERGLFLDSALPMADLEPAEAICGWILRHLADDGRFVPRTADELVDEVGPMVPRPGSHGRWAELLAATARLCGVERLPLLVFAAESKASPDDAPPAPIAPDRLEAVARILANLVSAHPPLPAAVVVGPAAWQDYLDRVPESRFKAILRQSVIPAEASRRIPHTAEEHARQAVADSLADPSDVEKADRARSAAERFLFERLEARPETAGLFRLNETLEIRFHSSRPIEVDLLARSLRLAVEIDGYYHFTSRDHYRRDRRKDALLQAHGHMVLRVLAEDVISHLEETLGAIREAVAHRRGLLEENERKDDA
ncbi:endonuclease domain-containing protein [Aquisphaera insulae]|uniref:endonuclease domain-containing protein n=1 Tax=Aquisphaera insulae TaxID=2712864 RepID=UPI0013ECE5AF|nr:DUF559 domain-containing protein [Aquisphaera insulae]